MEDLNDANDKNKQTSIQILNNIDTVNDGNYHNNNINSNSQKQLTRSTHQQLIASQLDININSNSRDDNDVVVEDEDQCDSNIAKLNTHTTEVERRRMESVSQFIDLSGSQSGCTEDSSTAEKNESVESLGIQDISDLTKSHHSSGGDDVNAYYELQLEQQRDSSTPKYALLSYRSKMDQNETFSIEEVFSVSSPLDGSGSSDHYDQLNQTRIIPAKLKDIRDSNEREKLFKEKIELCCKLYDFSINLLDDFEVKTAKEDILIELEDVIIDEPNLIMSFDSVYRELFRMFETNVFRSLPPSLNQNVPEYDPEEDEPPLEPAWPHLQPVYNLLIRFIDSPQFDVTRAKLHINEHFVLKLLGLFESEDPRERDYLKTMLHRIYGKFLGLRSYIRRQINNVFFSFIYESEYHNGISDLLEILGSIINGFVIPLKEEHKTLLLKVLMPLHKARTLNAYHAQLAYCIVQFIEKEPSLAEPVVKSLLKYWPKVHSIKEVMFLSEIEEILDITEPLAFKKVMEELFRQIARCIKSNQFQVAERALYFWNNDYILSLINDNVGVILPIVFPALHIDPSAHWNKTIHGLIYNALKLSTEMDQKLFHDLVLQHNIQKKRQAIIQDDKDRKWQKIQEMAEENALKINYHHPS